MKGRRRNTWVVMTIAAIWSRRLVVAALVIAAVASLLPAGAQQVVVLVLAAAGLLAGLPHGSVDHRLAAQLTGRPVLVVGACYAAVAVLTWVLLMTTGLLALVPVLALSLVHFGLGELEVVRATTGWRPSRAVSVALAVAGTGALLLPLARSGVQLAGVAVSISPSLGALLTLWPGRAAVAAVWALAAAVTVVAAARAGQHGVVLDVLLVGALGALAPPLVAFGVWFGGWHALRHCARLLTADGPSAALLAAGEQRQAVRALTRASALPTLAAVLVLAGLVTAAVSAADPDAALGTTLLVLLALTVPHMLVVLGIDRVSNSAHASRLPGAS